MKALFLALLLMVAVSAPAEARVTWKRVLTLPLVLPYFMAKSAVKGFIVFGGFTAIEGANYLDPDALH